MPNVEQEKSGETNGAHLLHFEFGRKMNLIGMHKLTAEF
jgi:hypothetical protein